MFVHGNLGDVVTGKPKKKSIKKFKKLILLKPQTYDMLVTIFEVV